MIVNYSSINSYYAENTRQYKPRNISYRNKLLWRWNSYWPVGNCIHYVFSSLKSATRVRSKIEGSLRKTWVYITQNWGKGTKVATKGQSKGVKMNTTVFFHNKVILIGNREISMIKNETKTVTQTIVVLSEERNKV